MELALLIAFVASTGAWLWYSDRRDRRQRDQVSELLTRIQHPQLVNPRVLEGEPPAPEPQEPDERELAGQVFSAGLPEGVRAEVPPEMEALHEALAGAPQQEG